MLDGYSEIEEDALACIDHYVSMKRGEFASALAPSTGEAPHVHTIVLVGQNARSIAERAAQILGRSDSPQLSEKSRKNLGAIADEMAAAADEAEEITHPDAVYAHLDRKLKQQLIERVPVSRDHADKLLARICGGRRKEPVGIIKKSSEGGTDKK